MRAEVIAVGTELLLGFTINDDASYVSRGLAGAGIDCFRHVTVGDNPARLAEALRASLERADLVVTCGGLGPTVDDVTLKTIASVTRRRLVHHPEILRKIQARFHRLGIRMPVSNRRQTLLPEGAVELPNALGTAPGFLLKLHHVDNSILSRSGGQAKYLAALPGPPAELIPILEQHLVPRLRRLSGKTVIRSKTLKTTGWSESEVDAKVRDLLSFRGETTLGIYAHAAQVDLRITAKAATARRAEQGIQQTERKLRARLGLLIYGADGETLEGVVGKLLRARKLTLSVAESCTGGLIQHRITEAPDASDYFTGGVISYANALKSTILFVPPAVVRKRGAVSRETAAAMADGVRRLTGSRLGLAVTGIAGPTGGTRQKPVGLVYIALATKRSATVQKFFFSGSRSTIKFKASQAALDLVRQYCLRSR